MASPKDHDVTQYLYSKQQVKSLASGLGLLLEEPEHAEWWQHQVYSSGRDETEVPGLYPRCPQPASCLLAQRECSLICRGH